MGIAFFYLNKHEPIHTHVENGDCEARFVLVPEIDLTYSRGFKKSELRIIVDLITEHYGTLINAWQKTFGK